MSISLLLSSSLLFKFRNNILKWDSDMCSIYLSYVLSSLTQQIETSFSIGQNVPLAHSTDVIWSGSCFTILTDELIYHGHKPNNSKNCVRPFSFTKSSSGKEAKYINIHTRALLSVNCVYTDMNIYNISYFIHIYTTIYT